MPFVRLMLPVLLSAANDDRAIGKVLTPASKPNSSAQIRSALQDQTFYDFLVAMVREYKSSYFSGGVYEFKSLEPYSLFLPKQKTLIFRANFTTKEIIKIALSEKTFLRRAKIPDILFCTFEKFSFPEVCSNFNQQLAQIIYSLTPTNLKENLNMNLQLLENIGPNYRRIYTNSAFIDSDIFKLTCYLTAIKGGEIIFGQHGGGWNLLKTFYERQMASDFATTIKYWSHHFSNNENKIKNSINVKIPKVRPANHKNVKAVFVEYAWPRHRTSLASIPQEDEVNEMFLENVSFFQEISIDLTIALYPHYDIGQRRSFYQQFCAENITFKPKNEPLDVLFRHSNLIVTSVPNTVFYQAIINNYPVVLWFAKGVEVDDAFEPLLAELKDCNIFHETALSCGRFVNQVNVQDWWRSKTVQKAVKRLKKELIGR